MIACIIFVLIQVGKSRGFGNGTVLLLHITMAYLYAIILIKYVYKFPQIQGIVDEESGVRVEALEAIGLIGGNMYVDLLPETIAMALIATIVKQRQKHIEREASGPLRESPTSKTSVWSVLWRGSMSSTQSFASPPVKSIRSKQRKRNEAGGRCP